MGKRENNDYCHPKESGFASGLFWGSLLGALGVFLFATEKGKKIREYLSEHGEKIFEEVEELYQQEEVEETYSKKKKPETSKSESKQDDATQDLSHIAKLQERGRQVAHRFFTRKGKTLR